MGERLFGRRPALILRKLALPFALLLGASASFAQRPDPLPVDTGATGLKQVLRQLQTTAHLMHTTAHPDDEDGGMLTLEARGHGVDTLLLTLDRGEGGQNKTGSNLFDELGVLRTLELLESDRYYGVQQRFTRLADFGYSKNAEETFQQWHGHDIGLGDMVRVIRTFRPDVIVSRFQGASRDGHGQHEAAGILSREAFRAAADPNRFPEQIREGLQPWQAKKLYVDNVRPGENYTVKLETTVVDPLLGASYAQFGMQGLKHQLSQGAGAWNLPPGPRFSMYKLVDSVIPPATDKDGHEPDFFAGIDTTIPGLASRVHADAIPNLKATLTEIQHDVEKATAAAEKSSYDAAEPLFLGLELTRQLIAEVSDSKVGALKKADLLEALQTKKSQFERAIALALDLQVIADPRMAASSLTPQGFEVFAAGDTLPLLVSVPTDEGNGLKIDRIQPELPSTWKWGKDVDIFGDPSSFRVLEGVTSFNIKIPPDAALSRPHFQRRNPETDTIYTVSTDPTAPLSPAPVRVRVDYSWHGHHASYHAVATSHQAAGPSTVAQKQVALAVGAPISVLLTPSASLIRAGTPKGFKVAVSATSYRFPPSPAFIRLQLPPGWQVTPKSQPLVLKNRLDQATATFTVRPDRLAEQHYTIRAIAESGGKTYSEGFSIVTREDLGVFYYYQPAIQKISAVNVNIPEGLKVGYVMGAGDDIPTALQQLGLDVHLITPDELAHADLSQFGTIVLGIRAYDTRDDLKQNHPRLLDYVKNGGTLLVQYNAGVQDFNSGNFTPYPAQLGRDRVAVEQAPVQVLAPTDPIFHYPNEITARDFDGWVQERGLYFMSSWDKQYEPLLASSDPGESPLQGGLLRARYGKGTYIYAGYAFFRQLPAGIPGAVRLFVNLIASGHNQSAAQSSNLGARP
ncbi:MAG: PIG-L family deacetylase [Acidobacteriia bacterium]|nr:PIG-L family deacetylase [Terriglobia bacterium]